MTIETVGGVFERLNSNSVNRWAEDSELKLTDPELKSITEIDFGPVKKNSSFLDVLAHQIGEVNKLQQDANEAIEKLATGQNKNIHETMLAVEQAEMAFKTMNQIRGKVIQAYKEIMNMQI